MYVYLHGSGTNVQFAFQLASVSIGIVNMTWTAIMECTHNNMTSTVPESVKLRLPWIQILGSNSHKITLARYEINVVSL